MDFKTIIDSHYQNNTLDLPASALAPGDAAQLIEKFIPDKRILIQAVSGKTDEASGVRFVGTGGNLPFTGMPVEVRFTWTAERLDFLITASLASNWDLGQSFLPLQNGFLRQLRFQAPTSLYLSTYNVSTEIKTGMTFSGTLETGTGGLQSYGFLASGASNVLLSGSIDYQNGAPQMVLKAPLATQVSLGFLTIAEIDILLHIESRLNSKTKTYLTSSYLEFKSSIEFSAQQKKYQIPLSASLYDPENNIQFDADLTQLVNAAVDELAFLLNNISPKTFIPPDFHLEDVIRLSHFNIQVDPLGANKLRSVRLSIDTTRSWELVKDAAGKSILSVQGVHLFFGLYAPFGSSNMRMGITGEIGIGQSGVIELGASYPDFAFRGALKAGTEIQLRELFTQILGYGAQGVPDLSIIELETNIKPSESYSLEVDVRGKWEIPVGAHSFAIEEIKFAIDYEKSKGATGSFEGIIGFDNQFLQLGASHPAADEGWIFKGGTVPGQQIDMQNLIADVEFFFNAEFPYFISHLSLKNLGVQYFTKNSDLALTCETVFPLENVAEDKWPDFTLDVSLNHVNGHYIKHLAGKLNLMDMQFDAAIETGGSANVIWGDYQNPGGKTFTVADILQLLSTDTQLLDATKGLKFNIKDAFVGYYKGEAQGAAAKWLLGLDMDFGADLSGLPLVGKYIPKEEALRLTFQPRIATQELTAAEITAFKGLIAGQNITLPATLPKGVTLDIQLNLGAVSVPMSLPIGLQNGQLANNSPAPAPGAAAAPAEKVSWYNLQKSFGPLQLQRVGVQFEKGLLSFLLDGGFSVGGLTLSLMGLSASTKLNPIALSFDLKGLGVDFKKDPIEIGGAFLKETLTDENNQPYTAYDGMAIIRAKQFALSAIGSYAEYQGHPSMFIYAVLDAPLGGPPFFFVKGLAAGFGFNRALKAPSIDQVQQFPLVTQAMAGSPNTVTDIGTQIRSLHTYMPPATGEYFLAAGIRFTSFEMIDSFALLIVSFGKQFEVDLLGLSTLVLPTPSAGNAVTPLAEVQMALKASFIPEIGFLGVEAKLTPASYLFSRDCHLTGGFAFYSWFSGEHNGDFALTLGGYHPSYQRPAHFPNVDRLGFNWVVTSNLSIKGDAYFALVPSAVMAGGHLNALWVDGNLSAWFTAGADFLLAWKPYHYDARLYVDVGVSYTYHFFGTHHITADVGADLHIWGPDFSGTARVHLWIITFTVSFGAGASATPPPLGWAEFKTAFLPANPAEICSISVKDGLEKKTGQGATAKFVVNPKDFTVGINSLIPIKSAQRQVSDNPAENKDVALVGANTGWGVGPMAMTSGDTDSWLVLRIKKGSSYVTEQFTVTPVFKSVPVAMWGQSASPSLNGSRLIEQAVCGFDITGLPPKTPKQLPQFIDRKNFQFSLDTIPDGWKWSDIPSPELASGTAINAPEKESTRRNTLRDHIETVQAQRTQLLKDLGFSTPVFPDKSIADAFIVAPRFTQAPA